MAGGAPPPRLAARGRYPLRWGMSLLGYEINDVLQHSRVSIAQACRIGQYSIICASER